MKVYLYLGSFLLAGSLLAGAASRLSLGDSRASEFVDDEYAESCGLDKLSDREVLNLLNLVKSFHGISFVEEAAQNYMIKQGWHRTDVLGYHYLKLSGDSEPTEYLLAYREGKMFVFDIPLITPRLEPGLYWSKGFGSSWDIMSPDGETENYWVKESR